MASGETEHLHACSLYYEQHLCHDLRASSVSLGGAHLGLMTLIHAPGLITLLLLICLITII